MTQISLKPDRQKDKKENNSASQIAPSDSFLFSLIPTGVIEMAQPPKSKQKERQSPRALIRLQQQLMGCWKDLSLRNKAMILAIAIGVIPVAAVGGIAYKIASHSMEAQIITEQENRTVGIRNALIARVDRLVDDAETITHSPLLTDAKLSATASIKQKISLLNGFIYARDREYDSIAVFDLKGNLLFQSKSERPFDPKENYSDREYFQRAIATKSVAINDPKLSPSSVQSGLEVAAPIKEWGSGKLIGVVRLRMPTEGLNKQLQYLESQGLEYQLIDSDGIVFAADETDLLGQTAQGDFKELPQLIERVFVLKEAIGNDKDASNLVVTQKLWDINDRAEALVSIAPIDGLEGTRGFGWSLLVSRPLAHALSPLQEVRWTLLLGTGAATLLVGALAAILAERGTRPILRAASAVRKIGQGKLGTRLEVKGEDEISLLGANINDMAAKLGMYMEDRVNLLEQQKSAKEQLQNRILDLLLEVEPISRGDLTVRAKVTEDEVGTLADSYNLMVENLSRIVERVKSAAKKVATTTVDNETSTQMLSEEALRQSKEITTALKRIQMMADSIRTVAANATQAESAVLQANQTIEAGDAAMNRTVDGMMAIKETVSDTAKKVKRLGETSQEISTIVNLIGNFAAQTNILALNASIEAARAGEQGKGFAVVAEEVRSLAQQSAQASAEIERLVAAIQRETREVVTAMDEGTEQVIAGTEVLDETRLSLSEIKYTSARINALVVEIAKATAIQSHDSQAVAQTMIEVAAIAKKTSQETSSVSASFKDLLEVAQELQKDVNQFKVE